MARYFIYDGRRFDDPDENMTTDQVKASLQDFFGELATAEVKETKEGEDTVIEFLRRVGTKGKGDDAV